EAGRRRGGGVLGATRNVTLEVLQPLVGECHRARKRYPSLAQPLLYIARHDLHRSSSSALNARIRSLRDTMATTRSSWSMTGRLRRPEVTMSSTAMATLSCARSQAVVRPVHSDTGRAQTVPSSAA